MRRDDLRCFVAISLSTALRKRLRREIGYLQLAGARVKWVPQDNLHMTVRFIGGVRPDEVMQVCDAVEEACEEAIPFRPTVRGLDTFPPGKPSPRVVVANVVDDVEPLKELFNELQRTLGLIGFKPERKGIRPHITLGRVRETEGCGDLMKKIADNSNRELGVIDVKAIHLMMSDPTPDGPIYTPMKTWSIA